MMTPAQCTSDSPSSKPCARKRRAYRYSILGVVALFILASIATILTMTNQHAQVISRAHNLFETPEIWKPWGENIIYTPIEVVSGTYYAVIIECALPHPGSIYAPGDVVDVDLFRPGTIDTRKRLRIHLSRLSDSPRTFSHVFQAHDNKEWLLRFINRSDTTISSTFIAYEEVSPLYARMHMALAHTPDLRVRIRTIARYSIPLLALICGLALRRKVYRSSTTVTFYLLLTCALFLAAFIWFPSSLWLLVRLTGISVLIFLMGYGITVWSCGRHLRDMCWFIMPALGISSYAVLSLLLAYIIPAPIAMAAACGGLIVFSLIYICYTRRKLISLRSWRPLVVCILLGLITGAAPLFTKVDYDTTVGVVCDAVRYTHMSQHFGQKGYAPFSSFEQTHALRYEPEKLWARAALFPVQAGVARVTFLRENRVFTFVMALFYMMFACALYAVWQKVLGGRLPFWGLMCVAVILINSMMISGIVDNYLSQVSALPVMAIILVIGLYFIRHPSIRTATAIVISASFLAQNYFVSLVLVSAGLGGMFLMSMTRITVRTTLLKRCICFAVVASVIALINFSGIYTFIQHIQLSNQLAVAREPHGGILNMVGLFSPLGIDSHLAYQYRISVDNFAPLFTQPMRWLLGIIAYIICLLCVYRTAWYRRACWIPFLGALIAMSLYFGYLQDAYLYYKSFSFLAPFALVSFFIGVEKLSAWRVPHKIAAISAFLLLFTSGYNYAISMYHYTRHHPLLLDYDVIEVYSFIEEHLSADTPFVADIKNTNREYWLVQSIAHLPLVIAGRRNDNHIDVTGTEWALVQRDAPHPVENAWWTASEAYYTVAQNRSFSLRRFIPPQERTVLFTLQESFDHTSGYIWSLSDNSSITNNLLRFAPSEREYEIAAINLDVLKSNTYYTFSVTVRAHEPRARGWFLVDLYGPGYDNSEQEILVDAADLDMSWQTVSKTFNTDSIPPRVALRVGTSADTTIDVRALSFIEEPPKRAKTQSITIIPHSRQ